MHKIKHFHRINRNNEWWDEKENYLRIPVNRKIDEWVEEVAQFRKRKIIYRYPYLTKRNLFAAQPRASRHQELCCLPNRHSA